MTSPLMSTYARADLAFQSGEGCWLTSTDGRRFLDFGAGIATSSLGHNHPQLVAAIQAQAARLMHVSNLYRVPEAETLAGRLVAASFADQVFFCNSGAEANEGMVKMIRRAQAEDGHPERYRIICFDGAFHGRTLAMLAATNNPKYLAGFGPKVDGFDHVPLNDLAAVRAMIGPATAGVMIEPIQGEGGMRVADPEFLRGLRSLCDEHRLILGFDEVQCGMGRTGRLFAHEWADVTPDVLATAKGIAGGFPMGAILARSTVARHLVAGSHGTTFGGGPLACAAAAAVIDVLLAPGFFEQLCHTADTLRQLLRELAARHAGVIAGVRGRGLMLGLECVVGNTLLAQACVEEGLLVVTAGQNVIRLIPPLIVAQAECDVALEKLERAVLRCSQDIAA